MEAAQLSGDWVRERSDQVIRRSLQQDLKAMLDKKLITADGATNQLVHRLPG